MKPHISRPTIRWRKVILIAVSSVTVAVATLAIPLIPSRPETRYLQDLRIIDSSDQPADLTKSRSSVCEIHGVEMSIGTVPVVYGLLDRPLQSTLAERASPHAYWTAAGGCIVRSSSPNARTYICPECVHHASSMTYSYWQPQPFLPPLNFPRLK